MSSARAARERESRGGERGQGREGRGQGGRGVCGAAPMQSRGAHRQGGASAARLRIEHAAASPPGRRKKTVLHLVGRAGFARLGCYSGGLAGLPGKSFSLLSSILFSIIM